MREYRTSIIERVFRVLHNALTMMLVVLGVGGLIISAVFFIAFIVQHLGDNHPILTGIFIVGLGSLIASLIEEISWY